MIIANPAKLKNLFFTNSFFDGPFLRRFFLFEGSFLGDFPFNLYVFSFYYNIRQLTHIQYL